ncbi:hypothetical protein BDZ85DRAFT_106418 [Elsinoe ampelina]|uniref:Uncharacterized protein n=1 Tax=Elsinoe ampelina TaxID=302913 RepID=A0A6A6FY78_9PEZI|nr:hypothetical protein BDZ85DRAFT_106418 [Elsinoe ampelina]
MEDLKTALDDSYCIYPDVVLISKHWTILLTRDSGVMALYCRNVAHGGKKGRRNEACRSPRSRMKLFLCLTAILCSFPQLVSFKTMSTDD